MYSPGVRVVITPVPSRLLVVVAETPEVEVVALTPVLPTDVVVSLTVVWAKAVLKATALTAPTAINLVNLFCFMFVLSFG
jgi:hypothetical protein